MTPVRLDRGAARSSLANSCETLSLPPAFLRSISAGGNQTNMTNPAYCTCPGTDSPSKMAAPKRRRRVAGLARQTQNGKHRTGRGKDLGSRRLGLESQTPTL